MLNKRLVRAVPESKKYIAGNVLCQWVSLLANIRLMAALTALVAALPQGKLTAEMTVEILFDAVVAVAVRAVCTLLSSRLSYLSSKAVKRTLRGKIYKKLLGLGASYQERVNTSEVVQVAVEGVDQLETYFGSYLPQFFYAMLAPLTLFGVLSFVNFRRRWCCSSACRSRRHCGGAAVGQSCLQILGAVHRLGRPSWRTCKG
ncbi:MAG: ABC transporter transmembrane domain-containing protein [Acutalibacter sp.]